MENLWNVMIVGQNNTPKGYKRLYEGVSEIMAEEWRRRLNKAGAAIVAVVRSR